MNDGLYYDRSDDLWYFEEGEGRAVAWDEGFGEFLVPELALTLLFGPMKLAQDARL